MNFGEVVLLDRPSRGKAFVAMSGGVDSSVTARLLQEQDWSVQGLTMDLGLGESEGDEVSPAVEKARAVAQRLDIDHTVVDLKEEFRSRVVDYFCREYACGRTPNPCVMCNEHVKFGLLFDKARDMGADVFATGHYARMEKKGDLALLYRGADPGKDQSYMLYRVPPRKLARVRFPVGSYTKEEVKEMAARWELPTLSSESQEICFVPDDYVSFLEERIPEAIEPGPIYDVSGKRLGTHQGLVRFTIGQRRGLGVAGRQRLYVVDIDTQENALVVGPNEETFVGDFLVADCRFLPCEELTTEEQVQIQIRYNGPAHPGTISPRRDGEVRVSFAEPQRAIAPGQAAVFYRGDLVMGGGTIQKVLK